MVSEVFTLNPNSFRTEDIVGSGVDTTYKHLVVCENISVVDK